MMDNSTYAAATMLVLEAGEAATEILDIYMANDELPDNLRESFMLIKIALDSQAMLIRLTTEHNMVVADKLDEILEKHLKD